MSHYVLCKRSRFFLSDGADEQGADPPIGVFIEAYSSGIVTQQAGPRGGTLPATPLYNASSPTYLGLSIDVEAVVALKKAYPRSMVGVRSFPPSPSAPAAGPPAY